MFKDQKSESTVTLTMNKRGIFIKTDRTRLRTRQREEIQYIQRNTP